MLHFKDLIRRKMMNWYPTLDPTVPVHHQRLEQNDNGSSLRLESSCLMLPEL